MDIVSAIPRQDAPALTQFTSPIPTPTPTPAPAAPVANPVWPHWQRVLFRFFCIYFALQIAPWNWFRLIPGVQTPATSTSGISSCR